MVGHGFHIAGLDKAGNRALVIEQRAVKDLGEALGRDFIGKGVLPCQVTQVAGTLGQLGRHAVRKAVEQRIIVHQALEQGNRARLGRTGRLDSAVEHLHVRDGAGVLPRRDVDTVHASGNVAHQHAGNAIDAVGGNDLARRRIILDRCPIALELQHQHVQVAFEHGVDLAARSLELGVGINNAKLLLVDKGVGIAIEHIVRQQAQRKGATQIGIARLQVRHAVAQARELARHARAVHDLSKRRTVGNARREYVEEKRVGALVSQDKGDALLVGRDNALRKTVDAFLAKQMMRNERGHNDPFDFIRCHPLCPPRGHTKPATANDGAPTLTLAPSAI